MENKKTDSVLDHIVSLQILGVFFLSKWPIIILSVVHLIIGNIFLMPPLEQRRIMDHFGMVLFLIGAPVVEAVLLILAGTLELLAENILECIWPRNPTSQEEIARREEEKRIRKNTTPEQRKAAEMNRAARVISAALDEYVKRKEEKKLQTGDNEKRHFWYLMVMVTYHNHFRHDDIEKYLPFMLRQLLYVRPELTGGFNEEKLRREFGAWCRKEWLTAFVPDPGERYDLENFMADDFVDRFADARKRYGGDMLATCLAHAFQCREEQWKKLR